MNASPQIADLTLHPDQTVTETADTKNEPIGTWWAIHELATQIVHYSIEITGGAAYRILIHPDGTQIQL
jgi:hypothetical protein